MNKDQPHPYGTYFTKDHKGGFVLIYQSPQSKLRESCWLVDNWWVTDNGPAHDWSLHCPRREYIGVRKVDLSQYRDAEKIQYARGDKSAEELGFFGA